ncbi:hypothetical protein LCGC14_2043560, partial [marine sediment metagenome]
MSSTNNESFQFSTSQKQKIKKYYKSYLKNPEWDLEIKESKENFDKYIRTKLEITTFNFTREDIVKILEFIQKLSNLDWAYGQILKALDDGNLDLKDLNQKLYNLYKIKGKRPEFYINLIELRELYQFGEVSSSLFGCYFDNKKNPFYSSQHWSVLKNIFQIDDWNQRFVIEGISDYNDKFKRYQQKFLYKIYVLKRFQEYLNSLDSSDFDFFRLNQFLWNIYKLDKELKKNKTEIRTDDVDKLELNHDILIKDILNQWKKVIFNYSSISKEDSKHFDLLNENLRNIQIMEEVKDYLANASAGEEDFRSFWDKLYSATQSGRAFFIIKKNRTNNDTFDIQKIKKTLRLMLNEEEYSTNWEGIEFISGARRTLWELYGALHEEVPIINNCSTKALTYLLNRKIPDDYTIIKNAIDEFKDVYLSKIGFLTNSNEDIKITIYQEMDKLFNVIDKVDLKDYEGVQDSEVKELFKLVRILKGTYQPKPSFEEDDIEVGFEIEHLIFENKDKLKKRITTALDQGKHLILIGPPGTGKSKLAKVICERLQGEDKYIFSTATSDWSTFETIGGYRLSKENQLDFEPGIFLQCFITKDNPENNKWLIIDEINRADIDKAFGSLFSSLTGDNVVLPY